MRRLEELRRRVGELAPWPEQNVAGSREIAAHVLVAHDRPVVHPALVGQPEDVLRGLVA